MQAKLGLNDGFRIYTIGILYPFAINRSLWFESSFFIYEKLIEILVKKIKA